MEGAWFETTPKKKGNRGSFARTSRSVAQDDNRIFAGAGYNRKPDAN
jgi:hypothetical protein